MRSLSSKSTAKNPKAIICIYNLYLKVPDQDQRSPVRDHVGFHPDVMRGIATNKAFIAAAIELAIKDCIDKGFDEVVLITYCNQNRHRSVGSGFLLREILLEAGHAVVVKHSRDAEESWPWPKMKGTCRGQCAICSHSRGREGQPHRGIEGTSGSPRGRGRAELEEGIRISQLEGARDVLLMWLPRAGKHPRSRTRLRLYDEFIGRGTPQCWLGPWRPPPRMKPGPEATSVNFRASTALETGHRAEDALPRKKPARHVCGRERLYSHCQPCLQV